jgi:hypothetical protein
MTTTNKQDAGWYPYNLDHHAQALVIKHRDEKDVLNESHKMRMAVAYGLERFWGEHLRFERESKQESKNKGKYWKNVWQILGKILEESDITLPDADTKVKFDDTTKIGETSSAIWKMSAETPDDYRIALTVLTQLCDSLVWWTQRYKKKDKKGKGEED